MTKMRIIVKKNEEEVSEEASNLIINEIKNKEKFVLGLATGETPIKTYAKLVNAYKQGDVDFSNVKAFNLDEYVGLEPSDVDSYSYYLHHNLLDSVNVNEENIHLLNGETIKINQIAKDYDLKLEKNGYTDLQILGIGLNGHIGFNEPNSYYDFGTHVTDLSESTINVNKRLFSEQNKMPTKAITMGIGSILKSKKIVLLATGSKKDEIMDKVIFSNQITPEIPATILKLHKDVTIIMDEEAAKTYLKKAGAERENIN